MAERTQTTEKTENTPSKSKKNEFIPFYFSDFVKGTRKFWWLVVLLALVFGGIRFYTSFKSYTPVYSTSATFTISTATDQGSATGGMTSYSYYFDTAMTTQLEASFPYILSSNILQDAICEELDLPYLPATLTPSSVPGSTMFTITCTGTNPQQVYDILMSAIDKCPEAARYVIGKIKFTMITNPYVPQTPTNKNSYVSDAVKAAVVGAVIGIGWILIYCVSRKTIRTKDEIGEQLGMETLSTLPHVSYKRHSQEIDRSILWTNPNVGRGFMESVRLLRNTVLHDLKENEKTVFVTSTAPGEGKTTVTANLALSIADAGKKVLLIDWDIRNPSICEALDLPMPEPTDGTGEEYKIFTTQKYKISILCFTSRRNYMKRMRTEYVRGLLDKLRDSYDLIIIDTPPCGLISDTEVIARAADAAVYVILQDTVRVSRIKEGLGNLLLANARVIGAVFNGAQSGLTGYGENYGYGAYGYYGKYGYGYGYKHYGYGYKNYGYGYGEDNSLRKRIERRLSSSRGGSSHSGSSQSSSSSGGSSHSASSSGGASRSGSSHGGSSSSRGGSSHGGSSSSRGGSSSSHSGSSRGGSSGGTSSHG